MEDSSPKKMLVRTAVGRRLIAYLTLFNGEDNKRLRTFIADNYTAAALERYPVAVRLAWHKSRKSEGGRLRVHQLMAIEDHAVVLILKSEAGGFYYSDMRVQDDYPHKIEVFNLRPVQGANIDVEPFQEDLS